MGNYAKITDILLLHVIIIKPQVKGKYHTFCKSIMKKILFLNSLLAKYDKML
jgi:hypothetical protein